MSAKAPRGDLIEAASNLFALPLWLGVAGAGAIAVMPVPDGGLGAAPEMIFLVVEIELEGPAEVEVETLASWIPPLGETSWACQVGFDTFVPVSELSRPITKSLGDPGAAD